MLCVLKSPEWAEGKYMSYNIDTWKTKKLDNLVIPLQSFYEHERKDCHPSQPEIVDAETMEVELECGCEQTINGILQDGFLKVTKLSMSGEGSGTFKSWIFDEALKKSTGYLEAVLIWEGGDSITRLIVDDGNLSEEEIEI